MDLQGGTSVLEKSALAFLAGVLIGGVATYFAVRDKERKRADEEIESVKAALSKDIFKKPEDEKTSQYGNVIDPKKTSIVVTPCTIALCAKEKGPQEDPSPEDIPEVISMESFVEDEEYEKETLIYYEGNGVLTDQFDHVIDLDKTIGREPLNHFGEEEEDTVYVRDRNLMVDYEVVLEHKDSPPTALMEGDEDDD